MLSEPHLGQQTSVPQRAFTSHASADFSSGNIWTTSKTERSDYWGCALIMGIVYPNGLTIGCLTLLTLSVEYPKIMIRIRMIEYLKIISSLLASLFAIIRYAPRLWYLLRDCIGMVKDTSRDSVTKAYIWYRKRLLCGKGGHDFQRVEVQCEFAHIMPFWRCKYCGKIGRRF